MFHPLLAAAGGRFGAPTNAKGNEHGALLETLMACAFKVLTPREESVITAYFGLDTGRQRTLDEVSTFLGLNVSRERVRQIGGEALEKLRMAPSAEYVHQVASLLEETRLGFWLAPGDPRLERAFVHAYRHTSVSPMGAWRLCLWVAGLRPEAGGRAVDGLDELIVGCAARLGPSRLEVLTQRVCEELISHPSIPRPALEKLDIGRRIQLLGPAILGEGGQYRVPSLAVLPPGRCRQALRLYTLIGVLEESGSPLHFSEIAARARARVSDWELDEHTVGSALSSRFRSHFQNRGRGMWALRPDVERRTQPDVVDDDEPLPPGRQRHRTGVGDLIYPYLKEHGAQSLDAIIVYVENQGSVVQRLSISVALSREKYRFRRAGRGIWEAI